MTPDANKKLSEAQGVHNRFLKAKHRDLSKLTATDLIEAELEAMRELGIAPENWFGSSQISFASTASDLTARLRTIAIIIEE